MLLDGPELLIAGLTVMIAAIVQSSVGFGLGMIAAPILLLIDPNFVPAPLMMNGVVLSLMVAYRDRVGIDLMGLKFALAGRILGLLPAALLLSLATQTVFDFTFASLVLVAVVVSAMGWSIEPTNRRALLAGAASGFMGTISGIGGPPIALLYQRSNALKIRGTLSGYFCIGATLSLFVLAGVGRLGWREVQLALFLSPAMVLGFLLSRPLADQLKQSNIRPIILGLSFGSAGAVLWRAIAQTI